MSEDQLASPPVGAPSLGERPLLTGAAVDTSAESRDQAASIELDVPSDELDTTEAAPEDLVVRRATVDGYQKFDTCVVDTAKDVTLAAETSDLGGLVVTTQVADQSADIDTDEPAGVPANKTDEPATDGPTNKTEEQPSDVTEDGTPGFGVLVAVLALAALR